MHNFYCVSCLLLLKSSLRAFASPVASDDNPAILSTDYSLFSGEDATLLGNGNDIDSINPSTVYLTWVMRARHVRMRLGGWRDSRARWFEWFCGERFGWQVAGWWSLRCGPPLQAGKSSAEEDHRSESRASNPQAWPWVGKRRRVRWHQWAPCSGLLSEKGENHCGSTLTSTRMSELYIQTCPYNHLAILFSVLRFRHPFFRPKMKHETDRARNSNRGLRWTSVLLLLRRRGSGLWPEANKCAPPPRFVYLLTLGVVGSNYWDL